ncbi:GspH/FimT family pseudopilin [Marinobacter sp.]|uniref:GspH/FimT family pseudopilin n=1 Tax=Marinobacter sp. TaxID=50741 RepID=UPI000C6857F0|nr:GspH/FimT family pseudopilin [Marinobacter sp.]MAO12709.1 pilus assembly protein [Marinobacter sp.]|tara:strand:+ start:929 stop:1588 length:660 start_codon:yes stop_codon:yes gene_type:complete
MLKDERKAHNGPFFPHASANSTLFASSSFGEVSRKRYFSVGFSLVELMVTMAVMAILLAAVAPSFSKMMARNDLAVASNAVRGALMVARETALIKGHPVSLCAGAPGTGCTGDWSAGQWLVFRDNNHNGALDTDETVIQHDTLPGAGGVVSIDGNGPLRSALVYTPLGHAERVSGAFGAGRLRVCVDRDITPNAREVIIGPSGRVRVQGVDFGGVCPSL